jgi:integrase/recombinase XerD
LRDVVQKEHPRDWAIFMLLNDTGMRSSELCGLNILDVRWDRAEVVIRAELAKNRSSRIVPISASLGALRKYRSIRGDSTERTQALFLSFYGTPVFSGGKTRGGRRLLGNAALSTQALTRTGLYQLVQKWGKLARIEEARCSPHTFRHYFATQYLRQGGNIVTLQRILGHSRLDVTERYLKTSNEDVRLAHAQFSPAFASN